MKKIKLLTLLAALVCAGSMWADVAVNGKLPNAFSVSATKVVYFSQGNLQYQGSTGSWRFAEHQYTYIGNNAGNTAPSADQTAWIDLFGWATSGWDNGNRNAYQPYSTSTTNSDYGVAATKSASETLTSDYANGDWGVYNSASLGSGWRTLTKNEWYFLFFDRYTSGTVNGTSKARYTEAKILTNGSGTNGLTYNICGIILFPDDFDGSKTYSGVTWGTINNTSDWGTTCTTAGWAALENAGCVFLPAAGYRAGTTMWEAGSRGFYWYSTVEYTEQADCLFFQSNYVAPQAYERRHKGISVRLVSETAPVKPAATVTSAPTAKEETISYNMSAKVLFNAGTASGGTMKYQVTTTNSKPATNEGSWSNSPDNKSAVGTYYLWYYVKGDSQHSDSEVFGPVTKAIEKGNRSFTAPTRYDGYYTLVWNGNPQTLYNAGSNTHTATLYYMVTESSTAPSKSDEGWATTIPQKTEIGTYYLWYYLDGGANYNDTEVNATGLDKTIVKATVNYTAPTAKTIAYDGESHQLVDPGTSSNGTVEYRIGSGEWSTTVPSASEIGPYSINWRVMANDPEHYNNWTPSTALASRIAAPIASITTSSSVTTLYTDYNQALINAWVDGSTLKLLQSFDIATWFSLTGKGNITLDLNGCGMRYTQNQTYPLYDLRDNTSLTIIDSNPTTTHKFEKGEYDNYASLNEASGTIIINGGYITGARASAIRVYNADASLTMNGGTLIGNYTSNEGGAVTVEEGLFTMNGGAISYNYAGNNGGGVMLVTGNDYTPGGAFVMNGGSITHNLVGNEGGGVCTRLYTNFTLNKTGDSNPEIRYNTHTYDPEPKNDNVYVARNYGNYGDVLINIGSGLDRTQHDMVGINVNPSNLDEVFTNGLGADGSNEYEKYFFGDIPYYPVQRYGSEARLHTEKYRLQITAPVAAATVTYDGNSYEMLSTPATTDGPADIKYKYHFKRHNGSWGSYSSYSTSLPQVTEAGVYEIKAKAYTTDGTHYYDSYESDAVTFTINRADIEYVAEPQRVDGLVYTGTPQELVTIASDNALQIVGSGHPISGSSTMIHYSVACAASNPGCEAQGWVSGLPNALNPGCYDVTYWVPISDNYNQIGDRHIYEICIADPVDPIAWDDVTDNTTAMHSLSGHVVSDLTISRAFTQSGDYNTLCLPINLSAEEIAASPLSKYIIQEFLNVSVVGTNGSLMKLNVRTVNNIVAGKPYLAKYDVDTYGPAAENTISSMHFDNARVGADVPVNTVTELADCIGTLKPSAFEQNNPNYLFVAANNTLKWSTESDRIKGFRAFFHIKAAAKAGSPVYQGMPARIAEQTDQTTEFDNIIVCEKESSAQKVLIDGHIYILRGDNIYTIDGQLVK